LRYGGRPGGAELSRSSLEISDDGEIPRAILGSTSIEIVKTGTVEKRPESSLVLFDKGGKVIWRAP
jgi:hypothetical protein